MKPFELIYKRGLNVQGEGETTFKMSGENLTPEEKDLLADYLGFYLKHTGGKMKVVDTFVSAFLMGIAYVGTHLKEDPPNEHHQG